MSSRWPSRSSRLDIARSIQLQAIPALDVTRAEAEVSRRDQDLTIARTNLQLQESLIKNALTKTLDDPVLEEMPVVPTDTLAGQDGAGHAGAHPRSDSGRRCRTRPNCRSRSIDLAQPRDQPQGRANALLPTVDLVGSYGGTGLAGWTNPAYTLGGMNRPCRPDFGGAFSNAFNGSAPDYFVGLHRQYPIRNRVAKADQYRSELEYRQAEVRLEAAEEADSHRGPQRAIRAGAERGPGAAAAKGPRSGAEAFRDHAERAAVGRGFQLSDLGSAARSGPGATRPGECHDGLSRNHRSSWTVQPEEL